MKRTPLKRKTRLNPVSKKRAAFYVECREFVKKKIDDAGGLCVVGKVVPDGCGGFADAIEVHEPLTRGRGGSIVDEDNIILVCRHCHTWIHDHPVIATFRGLLRSGNEAPIDLL